MLTQALGAATDGFKENSRVLSLLEDKAQKAAGLAGVFLAAAFSFLRKDALTALADFTGWWGLSALALAVALMLSCVFASGQVLRARQMITPPPADGIYERCMHRLSVVGGPNDAQRENHLRDQARAWIAALAVQQNAITFKSLWLVRTQRLLVIGMCAVVALLTVSIFVYGLRSSRPRANPSPQIYFKEISHGLLTLPQLPRSI